MHISIGAADICFLESNKVLRCTLHTGACGMAEEEVKLRPDPYLDLAHQLDTVNKALEAFKFQVPEKTYDIGFKNVIVGLKKNTEQLQQRLAIAAGFYAFLVRPIQHSPTK